MPAPNPLRPQPDSRFAFLQGFLKRPREVGSIIPSSRFLERRIVRSAGVEDTGIIVELGPGTGGTTRALLRAMKPTSKLLAHAALHSNVFRPCFSKQFFCAW